jgi:alpha-N-acetylglucosaminidase
MALFRRRQFLRGAMGGAFAATFLGSVSASSAPPVPLDLMAARAAIERLLGAQSGLAAQFDLRALPVDPNHADVFEIAGTTGDVRISGTSAVALLSGFQWWLKYVAGGHLSTNGDRIDLPGSLPAPDTPIRRTTTLSERYAYNFTVYGYTMPYWHWEDWERELDMLAASGYNRALMLVGQEVIWHETFQRFGLSELEVRQWIAQPAHQPWQWYGSITGYDSAASGYSGPVSTELISARVELGQKIMRRMWTLGITPVLPCFIGHVPDAVFAERNPGANVIPQGDYAGHPRPWWLAPTDPLWPRVAERFYAVQARYFGTSTHYSNDLIHEGGVLGDVKLADAGRTVQRALLEAVPDATWMLQAWQGNPREELIGSIDREKVLVLDLDSDDGPAWQASKGFWGTPWAWGTIQNFGGRLGMFGNMIEPGRTLPEVRALPATERGRLIGTAMIWEGTHHNPVVSDLLGEMAWRLEPVDLAAWVRDYVRRRYGQEDSHAQAAWTILLDTAYSFHATGHRSGEGPFETPFAAPPALTVTSASAFGPKTWRYPPEKFAPVLGEMLRVAPSIQGLATYRYDLVDVTRQHLANRARLLLDRIREAYQAKDLDRLSELSTRFLRYLDLTDQLLATHQDWLLGAWLDRAKRWASSPDESRVLEWNARSIVTIWTIKACLLSAYANRDWQGMVGDFYKGRWTRWFEELPRTLDSGEPPVFDDWCQRDDAWARGTQEYPTEPQGDTYAVASSIAAELETETG